MTITPTDLFRWYRRYGWSTPAGEWGVVQSRERAELHALLERGEADALARLLATMFRSSLYWGLVSLVGKDEAEMQAAFPFSVHWRVALWRKLTSRPDLRRLEAPSYGNPVCLGYDVNGSEVLVAVDTPRFDIYAERIVRATRGAGPVLELGGGYGGVALQVLRHHPAARLVLCDIPETLYLAGTWLSQGSGVDVGWWDEAPGAQVRLLPAQDLDAWTEPVEGVFAAHTFSGLDRATSARYLAWLEGSGARWFYHDDAVEESAPGVWFHDTIPETLAPDLIPPPCFREVWRERTPWVGMSDRFCEFFYQREGA